MYNRYYRRLRKLRSIAQERDVEKPSPLEASVGLYSNEKGEGVFNSSPRFQIEMPPHAH